MERPDLVAREIRGLLASLADQRKITDLKRRAPQHAATQADAGGAG